MPYEGVDRALKGERGDFVNALLVFISIYKLVCSSCHYSLVHYVSVLQSGAFSFCIHCSISFPFHRQVNDKFFQSSLV